jgi:hypothetical protein
VVESRWSLAPPPGGGESLGSREGGDCHRVEMTDTDVLAEFIEDAFAEWLKGKLA